MVYTLGISFFCQIWFANCFPRLQNDFEQFLPPEQLSECFSAFPRGPRSKKMLNLHAKRKESIKEDVSAHHELSTQFFQLEGGDGRRVVGVVRPRGSAAFHFLQLPRQFLHLGHRHAQLLLFFIEERSNRVQVGRWNTKANTLISFECTSTKFHFTLRWQLTV